MPGHLLALSDMLALDAADGGLPARCGSARVSVRGGPGVVVHWDEAASQARAVRLYEDYGVPDGGLPRWGVNEREGVEWAAAEAIVILGPSDAPRLEIGESLTRVRAWEAAP